MSEREQVIWKLRRLWKGKAPRVLDLFAGCGGFSLGFRHQGFEVAGAIESDESAVQIHGQNFFEPLLAPYHSVAKDITQTDPKEFLTELRQGEEPELAIDVIIGGPPCQAFSRIGRAKLREIANSPDAHLEDPRAQLYKQYIRFVRELKPLAVVMENVTDILSFDGRNVPEEICETLDDMGYECRYTTLNAVHFGVPQLRERMFLLGLAKELKLEPVFPEPTHHYRLPTGYQEGRKRAIGFAPEGSKFFIVPVDSQPSLPKAVGVKEALNDLPAITDHLAEYILPTYATDEVLSYRKGVKPSNFARQMRNWEALKAEGVSGHVIRYLPRDFRIFSAMSPGDQYPDAHRIATRLFEEELDRRRRSGQTLEVDSEEYLSLQKEYVPPYDPGKFPDKWRKLDPREPSRTLTAHLARDSYSHIHYDSEQARTISMREAARLQSFPDGFQFDCAMGPALKAIGNAVPPLLASEIASCVRDSLKAAMQRTDLQLETEFEGVRHIAAFRPRAKLVSLLGDQLISDAAVGLIELVKNSYDADATNVDVTLQGLTNPEDTVIIVHDNGIGMSLEDLTGKWFSPATSHKEQAKARNQRTKLGRLPIGEKGVGRFAAHKLGRRLTLVTRKEDQPEIVVSVDWDEFDSAELFLDGVTMRVEMREPELYTGNSTGTRMEMAIARSSWNLKLVKKVHRALRRLQSPFKRHRDRKFCVGFRCPEHPELENIDPVEFLERSHYNIKVRVSKSGIATYTYSCAHPEVDSREIENKESLVPLALSELSGNKPACGPFAFELYVWQRSVKHMKQSGISPAELNAMCGVSIYRDGLRVYPYGEPGNDWLYLDQERIQSPSEKLGNNQVVGLVYIDQGRNLELRDKTNREGLIENDAFNDLRALIRAAIKLFSVYWRKDRPGKEEKNYVLPPIGHEELARFLTSKLRDDNEEIKVPGKYRELFSDAKLSKEEAVKSLAEQIEAMGAIMRERKNTIDLLQSLALTGLAAERVTSQFSKHIGTFASALQELKPLIAKRGEVPEQYRALEYALKGIQSDFRTLSPYENLGRREAKRSVSVREAAQIAFNINHERLRKARVDWAIEGGDFEVVARPSALLQILDNLIDNASYWLSTTRNPRLLRIRISEARRLLTVADSGPGVHPEIADRIYRPFETLRSDAKGLGLHLVKELTDSMNASITLLNGKGERPEWATGAVFVLDYSASD